MQLQPTMLSRSKAMLMHPNIWFRLRLAVLQSMLMIWLDLLQGIMQQLQPMILSTLTPESVVNAQHTLVIWFGSFHGMMPPLAMMMLPRQ